MIKSHPYFLILYSLSYQSIYIQYPFTSSSSQLQNVKNPIRLSFQEVPMRVKFYPNRTGTTKITQQTISQL